MWGDHSKMEKPSAENSSGGSTNFVSFLTQHNVDSFEKASPFYIQKILQSAIGDI